MSFSSQTFFPRLAEKKFRLELLFYFLCLLVTASFVYHRGQDVSYDLRNYHFYMGYFLINGRFMEDLAAAGGLHSFFNPVADAVTYLSLTHLPFPLSAWVFLLIQLTSIPAIVLLAKDVASGLGYPRAFMPAIPAIVLCLLAPIWWAELGTSFTESWIAPIIIYGVYFLLSAHKGSVLSMTRIATAGVLFGLATGLKMTNGLFAISGFLMLAVLQYRSGFRVSLLTGVYFLAGCGVGFLLTAWWNWYLWSAWGSPVFPYYNAIFKSEFWAFTNWRNPSYATESIKSFQEFLTFIVQAAFGTGRMTGLIFADARFLFVTMLVPAAILCKPAMRMNRQLMAFLLFMASSFLLWLFMFSIHRYLLPFTLLLGLLIWVLVVRIVERDWLRKSLMIGLILCAGLLIKVPSWGHVPMTMGEKNPFQIEMDEQLYTTPARYVMVNDAISYILPSFHPDSKFYGLAFASHQISERIFRRLAEPSELPLRILTKYSSAHKMPIILQQAGYDPDNHLLDCKHFRTRFEPYIVCELHSRSENKAEVVLSDLSDLSEASHCAGVIDFINGASPVSQSSVRTDILLAVKGWLVASVEAADVPDTVYLVLSNAEGKRYLFDAERTQRIDVGKHFKKPALNYSGYEVVANVSKLFGQYHLGLAYEKDNNILVCPQFSIPIEINSRGGGEKNEVGSDLSNCPAQPLSWSCTTRP